MQKYAKVFFLLSLFISTPVFANDSAGTTAAGGIEFIKTPAVKMVKENLTISPTNVKVDYLFQNLSDKDITTRVFFPLPPYKILGANLSWDDEVSNDKNAPFKNFSVIVNGKPVAYQIKIQALFNGKDISATLKQAGIPLNPELASGQVPMDDQQYAKFQQWTAKAKALGLLDKKNYPRWQKQIIYYWTQTFPAKQALTITHDYKPAAGEFYAAKVPNLPQQTLTVKEVVQEIKDLFKLDLADLVNGKMFHQWLLQQSTKPVKDIYAFLYNVDYILTTGANWAGPIQQFTLTLNYPKDGMVAYNEFYTGKASNLIVIPGKTQISLKNFTPKQDLHILFGTTSIIQ